MITEALQVGNALLGFPFRFEFNNYPPFYVQKCSLPKREFELTEFGGAGQTLSVKQAGGEKVSEFTIECIVSATGPERLFWAKWQLDVRTRDTKLYYRDGTCALLGPNDEPSCMWDIEDAWPKHVEFEEFDAEDKKKLVKIKVTLDCNDCVMRIR